MRLAAARLVSALVVNAILPIDSEITEESARVLLLAAREEDRADIRTASLHAAANVLALSWGTTLQHRDSGLPETAASLVAATGFTDRSDSSKRGEQDSVSTKAHRAVLQSLEVLVSPPTSAVVDGIARRLAVAAEKMLERHAENSVRAFAAVSGTTSAAVHAATGLVTLWSSFHETAPLLSSTPTAVPRMVHATCVILGIAGAVNDPDLVRDCQKLLTRVARELPLSPEGSAALGSAVYEAVRRLGDEGEDSVMSHEVIVAVLDGHTLMINSALSYLWAADKDAPQRRRLYAAAAYALTKQLEPPTAVLSSALADSALESRYDCEAFASKNATIAVGRMRLLASIIDVLPLNERVQVRGGCRPDNSGQLLSSRFAEERSMQHDVSQHRAPLIVELIQEEEARFASGNLEGRNIQATALGSVCEHDLDPPITLATAVALAAAGYARSYEIHGAGGIPKWSSRQAADIASEILVRCFSVKSRDEISSVSLDDALAKPRATTGSKNEFDDNVREHLAHCLSEAAPSLAHCLKPEPEPEWGNELSRPLGRQMGPSAPELPPELAQTLQVASPEGAMVAAVRLRWLLLAAGYPWIGCVEVKDDNSATGVVSRVVPCVLRAMDHQNTVVRREGCAALVALVASTSRTELRWHSDLLIDAASSSLTGSNAETFGAAAAAFARVVLAVCSDDPRDSRLMSALTLMIETANSRSHEPAVAAAWVMEAPALISAVKLCAAAHLSRLLAPLLGWLHARDDNTALGAAACLELLCKMTWPRVPSHASDMWPDIMRAYIEADARGGLAITADLRAKLKRLAAVIQLAAGEEFEKAWRQDSDKRVSPELAPLVSYLKQLPARNGPSDWAGQKGV